MIDRMALVFAIHAGADWPDHSHLSWHGHPFPEFYSKHLADYPVQIWRHGATSQQRKAIEMNTWYGRLIGFFALACAFTWFGNLGNVLVPSPFWPTPMNPLGPLMAAPIFILLIDGRAGVAAWWRRIMTFRAPVWVYAIAFFGPLGVILGAGWLAALAGAPTGPLPAYSLGEVALLAPLMLLAGPLPEELAFRGYVQNEVQRQISPLLAALLIGFGVVVWHLPLLATGELPWPWAICIVAVSVVYAWLMNKGQSPWPAVTVHFVVNFFGGQFFGLIITSPEGQMLYAEIYMALYVLWAAGIALLSGPSLGLSRSKEGVFVSAIA